MRLPPRWMPIGMGNERGDYLITGDRDFTEAYKLLTTTVCSVPQFKRLVIDTEPN